MILVSFSNYWAVHYKLKDSQWFILLCIYIFVVDACEQQQKHGRQMAAEALLSMESPSTNSESKTFLQGILHLQQQQLQELQAQSNGE